ncbi:MAG: branched-chain amino acid transaminase [Gammaproteobacteria bacterium]|nr:branched-chain amino acid transaminase [Gammaproteobacteria bacterium]
MHDRDGVIWVDGKLTPWRDATTHVLTHGLHYGTGVFEGLRAYATAKGPAIFRLQDHTRRLLNSAKIMQMPAPYGADELNAAQKQVVRENGLNAAYVRPLLYYGSEGMGLHAANLKVHCIIAAWEWGTYLGENALQHGIRIKTSSFSRHHVNVNMCKAKSTGSYINSILALNEVSACGYDEALLLDTDGYVSEGSGENFFCVQNGVLFTPDLSSCLNGITRNTIIELAGEMAIEVREKRISRDEVYIADEAFFTGSAAEVTPIIELDNRMIGSGDRGPVTEKLQKAYFDLVYGRSDRHADWLSHV